MQNRAPLRLRQGLLLLAALLHLAGAAAAPALHALFPAAPSAPGEHVSSAVHPVRTEAPSAFVHDETACVLCQAAQPDVLLPGGAHGIAAEARAAAAPAPPAALRPAPRDAGSLARAPPAIG